MRSRLQDKTVSQKMNKINKYSAYSLMALRTCDSGVTNALYLVTESVAIPQPAQRGPLLPGPVGLAGEGAMAPAWAKDTHISLQLHTV